MTTGQLSRFLGTSFLVAAGFILVWFLLYIAAGDLIFSIHAALFDIDRAQFEAMNYFGMTFIKLLAFVLFLIPWIALKITGKRKGQST
jgi:hypothetical protein